MPKYVEVMGHQNVYLTFDMVPTVDLELSKHDRDFIFEDLVDAIDETLADSSDNTYDYLDYKSDIQDDTKYKANETYTIQTYVRYGVTINGTIYGGFNPDGSEYQSFECSPGYVSGTTKSDLVKKLKELIEIGEFIVPESIVIDLCDLDYDESDVDYD